MKFKWPSKLEQWAIIKVRLNRITFQLHAALIPSACFNNINGFLLKYCDDEITIPLM